MTNPLRFKSLDHFAAFNVCMLLRIPQDDRLPNLYLVGLYLIYISTVLDKNKNGLTLITLVFPVPFFGGNEVRFANNPSSFTIFNPKVVFVLVGKVPAQRNPDTWPSERLKFL